jgi:4-amino-4-deoxy-L-arabinose transferase-like glycosyltransferase
VRATLAGPRGVALIALAALAVRAPLWWWTFPTEPMSDELRYHLIARHLALGLPVADLGEWPPGAIVAFAGLQRVLGATPQAGRLASVAGGIATCCLAYLLARRVAGPRAAAVAGLAAALYPTLALHDVSLWSESTYLPLALGGMVLVSAAGGAPAATRVATGAVLLALATLTREVGVFLAAAVALWLLAEPGDGRRRAAARAALFVAVYALVLLPWTTFVNRGHDVFYLVSRHTYRNLYIGNVPETRQKEPRGFLGREQGHFAAHDAYRALGPTERERAPIARQQVAAAIRARLPAWPLEKALTELPRLFTPGSVPVGRLRALPDDKGTAGEWAYRFRDPEPARWFRNGLAAVAVGAWVVVAVAGALRLGPLLGSPPGRLLAVSCVAHAVPPLLTFAVSRFRLPIEIVLLVAAATWCAGPRQVWAEAGPRRRIAGLAACGLLVVLLLARWSDVAVPKWV